jgi:quinoprotein glucose dehydrogenase
MKAYGLTAALLAGAISGGAQAPKQSYSNWNDYGGSADSMQYSALKLIDKSNVNRLELAWSVMAPGPSGRFSFNPLVIDGVMYVVGKDTKRGASPISRSARPPMTYTAPTAKERGCLAIVCWRSMPRPASASGTFRRFTMTCGITTSPRRRKLLTVRRNGKTVDVVAQATKFGFLYVFDRVTGQPIWPIEERPVPKSDMPGEESWPTQPFPTAPPPFARQKFTVDDINPYVDAEERKRLREIVANARTEGVFTPPAYNRNQISAPGENGGANQGSAAADPVTGMMYVKTYDAPTIHKMTETPPGNQRLAALGTPEQEGYGLYQQNCLACHGPNRERITFPKTMGLEQFTATLRGGKGEMPAFSESTLTADRVHSLAAYLQNPAAGEASAGGRGARSPIPPPPAGQTRFFGPFGSIFRTNNGLAAFSPPWSSIVAYDLNEGTIKWQRPIGTTPGLAAQGIKDTGSSALIRNGPVVTAGGLLIIASGPDRMIHILDKETGRTLWETELKANPDGIPAVYEAGGREYIAFFAAASGAKESPFYKPADPDSQGYYVFSISK